MSFAHRLVPRIKVCNLLRTLIPTPTHVGVARKWIPATSCRSPNLGTPEHAPLPKRWTTIHRDRSEDAIFHARDDFSNPIISRRLLRFLRDSQTLSSGFSSRHKQGCRHFERHPYAFGLAIVARSWIDVHVCLSAAGWFLPPCIPPLPRTSLLFQSHGKSVQAHRTSFQLTS